MDTTQRYLLFGLLIVLNLLALIRDVLFYQMYPTGRDLLIIILSVVIMIVILILARDTIIARKHIWIPSDRLRMLLAFVCGLLVVGTFLLRLGYFQ